MSILLASSSAKMHWAFLWLPWRFKALSPVDIVQWSVFMPSACLAMTTSPSLTEVTRERQALMMQL